MDIVSGKKLSSVYDANMDLIIGKFVHPVGGKGRGKGNGLWVSLF